jgi:hypothetical protein
MPRMKHEQVNTDSLTMPRDSTVEMFMEKKRKMYKHTLRISSCILCFFVSRDEPSGFNFRVHRSLYKISKLGLRFRTFGSTGGSMFGF